MKSSWKTVLSNISFWLDYFFFYELISDEWVKRLEYEGACHFPELGERVRLPLTGEAGLILELGKSLPDATLKVYDASCPEGIRIGHYDDGHPCNFVFRWEELVKISEHLSKQVPECPAAPFILLSVFGPPTVHDDWAEVKSRVRRAWKSLGLFPEAFIDEEILEMYRQPHDDCRWTYDPEFGWYCEGEYVHTLRHPGNADFPVRLFNKLLDSVKAN